MPLVKISLRSGRSSQDKDAIASAIQDALVGNLGIPPEDRYQLFTEYDEDNFRHTGAYLGMSYSDQLLIIEITFLQGRDDEIKKMLLADINRNLVAAGVVSADDVFVMITEIGLANISFGQGQAQRAPAVATAG